MTDMTESACAEITRVTGYQLDPERRARMGANWNDFAALYNAYARLFPLPQLRYFDATRTSDDVPRVEPDWDTRMAELADHASILAMDPADAEAFVRSRLLALKAEPDIKGKPTSKKSRGGRRRGRWQPGGVRRERSTLVGSI